MPSKTVELAVLDTSVYIANFRTGRFTQRITESPFLFRGISVVMHELLRGARRPTEQEFALDLAANLRLYTPTERIWLDSASVLGQQGFVYLDEPLWAVVDRTLNNLLYVFVDNDQPVGNGLGLRRRTGPRYRHQEKPTKRTLNSAVFYNNKLPSILSVFKPCKNQLLCLLPCEHTYQFS